MLLSLLIGEEIRQIVKITEQIKEEYASIDWEGWMKTRNRITHENYQLNLKEVYDFIIKEFIALKKELPHLIEHLESMTIQSEIDRDISIQR